MHAVGHAQLGYCLSKKGAAAQEWFEENHLKVGANDAPHQSGQPCARSHIHHPRTSGNPGEGGVGDNGAVEKVAIPEAINLTRSNQAPLGTGSGEEIVKGTELRTEGLKPFRERRCFT